MKSRGIERVVREEPGTVAGLLWRVSEPVQRALGSVITWLSSHDLHGFGIGDVQINNGIAIGFTAGHRLRKARRAGGNAEEADFYGAVRQWAEVHFAIGGLIRAYCGELCVGANHEHIRYALHRQTGIRRHAALARGTDPGPVGKV